MRSMQEILDVVFAHGYYAPRSEIYGSLAKYAYPGNRSWFMCDCLNYARDDKRITEEERTFARGEIREYIGGYSWMETFLEWKGCASSFTDRLAIYKNWDNRPRF